MIAQEPSPEPSYAEIVRRWGRIGCLGFGGPPAHIALFRELCVEREKWLADESFERAVAATNLRTRGGLLGGLSFVLPGLVLMLALSALFLSGSPPSWLRGAGLGAGAALAAVAVRAGLGLAGPIWRRAAGRERPRVLLYGLAAGAVAAAAGSDLVVVLLACGAAELAWHARRGRRIASFAWPLLAREHLSGVSHAKAPLTGLLLRAPLIAAAAEGGTGALAWTALKVGALAFGGGFVIVPLMQSEAVGTYHWMTNGQFLNAVALGQITPGPVTQTIAAVGYAAGGLAGGLFAALIAFAPSFAFILFGAARFERLLVDARVLGFLAGAAPAAAGAIIGSSIPLAGAISESWQYVVLAAAAIALLALRRPVLATLIAAGGAGALAVLLGAPLPHA